MIVIIHCELKNNHDPQLIITLSFGSPTLQRWPLDCCLHTFFWSNSFLYQNLHLWLDELMTLMVWVESAKKNLSLFIVDPNQTPCTEFVCFNITKHKGIYTRALMSRIIKPLSLSLSLSLTQLCDLSVEGAADCSAMERQPGKTVVTHCVATEQ